MKDRVKVGIKDESHLKLNSGRIRIAEHFEANATDMLAAVRQQRLEGVIAKRKDSLYEAGKRSGSWIKYRVNRGQELVIDGYLPGPHGFDSLIVGYYRGKDLMYVARVRNGFVPASRRQVFEKIRHLVSPGNRTAVRLDDLPGPRAQPSPMRQKLTLKKIC